LGSAYFEAVKQKGYEVLFLFEQYDEVVILQLMQYQKNNLVSIEQEISAEKNNDDIIIEGDTRSLNNDDAKALKEWLKKNLSNKVKNVKVN
jgi:TNF receptor-associated protein 1